MVTPLEQAEAEYQQLLDDVLAKHDELSVVNRELNKMRKLSGAFGYDRIAKFEDRRYALVVEVRELQNTLSSKKRQLAALRAEFYRGKKATREQHKDFFRHFMDVAREQLTGQQFDAIKDEAQRRTDA